MNARQFDGTAPFSCGGSMPSQPQATRSADPSLAPARSRDSQGPLPLTVKQIIEASLSSKWKANVIVDGVVANTVTLVGMVYDKVERSTDYSFFIDDGTGRIEVCKWSNTPIDSQETPQNGMYVRVIGPLNALLGKSQLVAYSVRPVIDFSEITNHFTECMSVHSEHTKLQKVGSSTRTDAPGTSGLDRMILEYLQQPSIVGREEGAHRDELAQHLDVPKKKIMQSLLIMEEEALVYSTVDDWHFKSTAGDALLPHFET